MDQQPSVPAQNTPVRQAQLAVKIHAIASIVVGGLIILSFLMFMLLWAFITGPYGFPIETGVVIIVAIVTLIGAYLLTSGILLLKHPALTTIKALTVANLVVSIISLNAPYAVTAIYCLTQMKHLQSVA